MPTSKSSWARDKVRDIAGAYKCFSLSLFFFKNIYLFIWLHQVLVVALQDLQSLLQHSGSLVVTCELLVAAYGI